MQQKVDFSIELPLEIKAKLESGFDIHLQQITSIPMRWIKGDTPPHISFIYYTYKYILLVYEYPDKKKTPIQ